MSNFLLGILHDGAMKSPEEMAGEEMTPCYFDSNAAAKIAGRALLDRQPSAVGFVVRRIFNGGHFRTVAVVAREEGR